jgi:hypothetical protein
MKQPARFEGLGASGLARRIADIDPGDADRLEVARAALDEAEERVGAVDPDLPGGGRNIYTGRFRADPAKAASKDGRAGFLRELAAEHGPSVFPEAFTKDGALKEDVAPAKKEDAGKADEPSSPKGGRPAKHVGKPWEAEGISRALWYRRRQVVK